MGTQSPNANLKPKAAGNPARPGFNFHFVPPKEYYDYDGELVYFKRYVKGNPMAFTHTGKRYQDKIMMPDWGPGLFGKSLREELKDGHLSL